MTPEERGREGVSQFVTKGEEVTWIWNWQGGGEGVQNPENLANFIQRVEHRLLTKNFVTSTTDSLSEMSMGRERVRNPENFADVHYVMDGS